MLHDRAAAIRQGYYFESSDQHYDLLFAAARDELVLPARDAQAWLKLDAATRAPWLQRGGLRATAGLLLLEQAASARAELRARDTLKRALLAERDSDGARQLQGLLELAGQWLQPGAVLGGTGYGLPQADELAALQPRLLAASTQAPQAWKQLRQQMRAQLPVQQRQELDTLDANLMALRTHLRAQAAAPAPAGI